MATSTFAAIDVGSNEVAMKVYQIGKKNNITTLTHIRHVMKLGSDTYASGYISNPLIEELCDVLNGFADIMKDFGVTHYKAYSTSSIREAANRHFLLDRISVRTGLTVNIPSNSEQRYLLFQGVALHEPDFDEIIKNGALVVEVGSGSSQATCFSDGLIKVTQNLRLGSVRINEFLGSLERTTDSYHELLSEYIEGDIYTSYKNYFKDYKINTILAVGEGIINLHKYIKYFHPEGDTLTSVEMTDMYNSLKKRSSRDLAQIVETSEEQARLILPTAMIYKQLMDINHAHFIKWGTSDLCDGIIAEYAQSKKSLRLGRDFSQDIISAATEIALRYSSNMAHTAYVEKLGDMLFDCSKNVTGLNGRDKLLLKIAIILHDCGSYINFQEVSTNSYKIIRASEIIGLSDEENRIIAGIVLYHTGTFPSYSEVSDNYTLEEYMRTAKLTALFNIANNLDTSKKQKLSHVKITFNKNNKLVISGETFMDLALEQAYFDAAVNFFEQIYGIRPVLKQRRISNV